jgi:hypothetical protein
VALGQRITLVGGVFLGLRALAGLGERLVTFGLGGSGSWGVSLEVPRLGGFQPLASHRLIGGPLQESLAQYHAEP